jgi:hypothetical protein
MTSMRILLPPVLSALSGVAAVAGATTIVAGRALVETGESRALLLAALVALALASTRHRQQSPHKEARCQHSWCSCIWRRSGQNASSCLCHAS